MTLQQFLGSPEFRRRYWARNHLGWRHMDSALPNAAHRTLAGLPGVRAVITQNVDLLHLKAGSRGVIDLHGNYAQVRCLRCEARISRHHLHSVLAPLNAGFVARVAGRGALEVAPDADVVVEDTTDFTMVDCTRCGGILKPDIVYFGESVPKPRVQRAFAAVDDAEALLVLGTSLTVMSGLRFVRHAAKQGKPVVIVNRGRTRGDELATVTVDVDVATALTALLTADRTPAPGLEVVR